MRNLAPMLFGACAIALGASTAASAIPLTSGMAASLAAAAQNDPAIAVGYRYYSDGSYYRRYRTAYYGARRSYAYGGYSYDRPARYVYNYPYTYSSYYGYPSYYADYGYPSYYASYNYPYYYPRYGYYRPTLGLGFYIGW
jgi:hypothetical protein